MSLIGSTFAVLFVEPTPAKAKTIMKSGPGRFARLLIITLLIPSVRSASPSAPAAQPTGETPTAAEVRLRKLHLVRPDLIPYPIAYEVCC
jgi:hypothetical protein